MTRSIQFSMVFFLFFFSGLSLNAQGKNAIISIHRFSVGLSINKGSFFLKGSENGHELSAADLNRHENSTKAETVGGGISFNYRIVKSLDLVYDYAIEYAVEDIVDHYWIKSNNFGLKYRPIAFGNFSPYAQLSYSDYSVGEISVHDITRTTGGKKGQYLWDGKGATFSLGAELKINKLYYSLGYHKLFTKGQMLAREGGVVFENKPKHHYFDFNFRIEF